MGSTASKVAAGAAAVNSAVRGATGVAVDPDIELAEGTVAQLALVLDTGARRRVQTGLGDFSKLYQGTFRADSRVSVFDMYDCMSSTSDAFMQLQYDCGWEPDSSEAVTWARNLAISRMQACVDEAVQRTGMVDPRPFTTDAVEHDKYMALMRAWPGSGTGVQSRGQ